MKENDYLGVMLDCSRNSVMKVEELKKFILVLKKMGYNCLQLYTEDTYEIEGEPQFGYRRGKYSKAELKEIDAFAAENGIELIPCIQTLAHLNAIFRYERYQKINDTADILLTDDENTYEFIEKMIKTCAECFTSRNIHIGMDEAHMLGKGKYYDKHGDKNRFDILLKHLMRVTDILKKYGFTPMMWSDMFFCLAGGGAYYHDKPIPAEVREKVPQEMQLVYWDYYHENAELLDGMIESHLSFNRPVWIAGGAWTWRGLQSDNAKSFRQTKAFIESARKYGVNNILMTMWGDNGGECSPYALLPSLMYAAQCARGNFDLNQAKAKFESLFGEKWDDFLLCDFPCPAGVGEEGFQLGVKELLYSDYFLSTFDCGVLGTGQEREVYRTLAEGLEAAAKNSKEYAYMFASYAALCRVLSVKYDLGYLTREAYQKGDKKALAALLPDYEKTLGLLEEFTAKYENMWFKENKPHGFDVQDIRLGGIMQRTKSCMRRLKEYVDGKSDRVEELEEATVNFITGGKPDPEHCGARYNQYSLIASANCM